MRLSKLLVLIALLVSASCSPEASKQYLAPTYQTLKTIDKGDVNYSNGKVDILFVVDNSGSMGIHQTNLSSNVDVFLNEFFEGHMLDYHIGVVTTDMDYCTYSSLSAGTCGLLFGKVKYVDKNTADIVNILKNNLKPGTSGSSSEESFAPVEAALTAPKAVSANKGFYRSDAYLAVIFITDTEDQSYGLTALNFYKKLVSLKGGSTKKVLGYGVFIPTKEMENCEGEHLAPTKIEEFLNMVINAKSAQNQFSLCDPAFGQRLTEIGENIVSQVTSVFYLKDLPDVDSIQVTYGSLVLPKHPKLGWMYNSKMNAIVLGKDIDWESQPEGSQVNVTYDKADLDAE